MIGRKLLHYEVIESLGEGGMGVVYRARDTRLKRDVAIKFLPRHIAAGARDRRRFEGEAGAAAALNHPNVAHVYAIEEVDGEPFIVMEYVAGRELRRVIAEDNLSLERAVGLAMQISRGLKEAHDRGVVHRDIKSANIMVTGDGQVKVMDFGLAKMRGETRVTQTGMTMGTPDYMSPEQVRGEDVDHRTDIWSFGIVLYELLTGERPFRGDYDQAVMYSILNSEPAPPSSRVSGLPHTADEIALKALARNRDDRFQGMDEVIAALDALGKPAARSAPAAAKSVRSGLPSIAVLPFANMSNDPDQAYFCDGIAEDIINDLTRIEGLRVAARTTSFAHRAASVDIREIGAQIGVDSVLEGSVRKAGNRLRIVAQLIDVSNGYHVWSKRWDRELADVFAIQDEIAHAITAALRVSLTARDQKALANRGTNNLEAYDLFLQGRRLMHEGLRGMRDARLVLQAAVDRDPNFALAHAILALNGIFLTYFFPREGDLSVPSRAAAERALELDPGLAEAHTAKAHLLAMQGRENEAEQSFKTALELNPDLYEARYFYGRLFFVQRKWADVVEQWERAIEIDPNEYQCAVMIDAPYREMGWTEAQRRPIYERAVARAQAYIARHPESSRAYYLGSTALFCLGRREEALAWIERSLQVDPLDSFAHYNVACSLAVAGEYEGAIQHIEQAVDLGFTGVQWLDSDPDLNPLRDDPRFQACADKARKKQART